MIANRSGLSRSNARYLLSRDPQTQERSGALISGRFCGFPGCAFFENGADHRTHPPHLPILVWELRLQGIAFCFLLTKLKGETFSQYLATWRASTGSTR